MKGYWNLPEDTTNVVVDGWFSTGDIGLVDEDGLLWALEHGPLRAAALDVLDHEPPPPSHPLLGRDDVLVTPHMGPHTAEATAAMGERALDDLLAVLSGQAPRYPV